MLTSRNDDLRWILATIVESGNHRFWGWLRDVFFASVFLAYVEPNLFFAFGRENSPVQPLLPGARQTTALDPHPSPQCQARARQQRRGVDGARSKQPP
jgi:hypothetical protein